MRIKNIIIFVEDLHFLFHYMVEAPISIMDKKEVRSAKEVAG